MGSNCYSQVPVILVGNKIDLRGGEVTNEALSDEVLPIMNEFKVRGQQRHPDSDYSTIPVRKLTLVSNALQECS